MPLPLWLCSGSHAAVPAHAVTTLQEKLRGKQSGWAPGSDHIRSAKERSTHHKPSQPEHPGEGGISSSLALLPLDTGQGTVTAPLSLREAASAPSQSPEPAQGREKQSLVLLGHSGRIWQLLLNEKCSQRHVGNSDLRRRRGRADPARCMCQGRQTFQSHSHSAKLIPVKLGENKGLIRERCSPAHAEPGWRAQL